MPKLSGLTTDGEATVPLGDLAPFTEEQLLARAHRVHVLFACMDCKKSWVELREMLRHMVEGGCLGEAGKGEHNECRGLPSGGGCRAQDRAPRKGAPYRLVYKTHFFAPKLNIKRGGASYT